MTSRALARAGFVARFRPPHLGHAAVLAALARSTETVVVGVGSANRYDLDNPFTGEETADLLRPPSRVVLVHVPSRFTDPRSTEAARAIAAVLGTRLEGRPLEPLLAPFEAQLADLLDGSTAGRRAHENLQARIRMSVLAALVNRNGRRGVPAPGGGDSGPGPGDLLTLSGSSKLGRLSPTPQRSMNSP